MARLPPNPQSLLSNSSHNFNNNINNNNISFPTFEPHGEACTQNQGSMNPISYHNQYSQSNYNNHNYPQTMNPAQQYQFQSLKGQYRPSSQSRDSSLFLDSFGNNAYDTTNNNQNLFLVSTTQNVCFVNFQPPAKKRQCIRTGYNDNYIFNSRTLSSKNKNNNDSQDSNNRDFK